VYLAASAEGFPPLSFFCESRPALHSPNEMRLKRSWHPSKLLLFLSARLWTPLCETCSFTPDSNSGVFRPGNRLPLVYFPFLFAWTSKGHQEFQRRFLSPCLRTFSPLGISVLPFLDANSPSVRQREKDPNSFFLFSRASSRLQRRVRLALRFSFFSPFARFLALRSREFFPSRRISKN